MNLSAPRLFCVALVAHLPVLETVVPRVQEDAQEEQAAAAESELPEARAIIDRFLEVTNLGEIVRTTNGIQVVAELDVPSAGMDAGYKAWYAKPTRFLEEIDLGSYGVARNGCDGAAVWTSHPFMGDHLIKGLERTIVLSKAPYHEWLRPADWYESIETVGKERFEGAECYRIKFVLKRDPENEVVDTLALRTSYAFYAVDSGLLRGKIEVADGGSGLSETVTFLDEYEEFDGARVATYRRSKAGYTVSHIRIETIRFEDVDDSVFRMPRLVAKQQ